MYATLNLTAPIGTLNHCGHIGHTVNDLEKICYLAHQYQFEGINIDFTVPNLLSVSECKRLLSQLNLKPVSFGSQKEFEENLPQFELQAKQAQEIGCHLTLCYLPPFADDRNFNDLFIQTSDRLRELKPILQKYDIKIGFEFIGPTETRRSTKYDFIHTIDGTRALIASAGLYGYGGLKFDVNLVLSLGLTTEELTKVGNPKVVSTSCQNVLEEYFSHHQNLNSQIEGRLTYK